MLQVSQVRINVGELYTTTTLDTGINQIVAVIVPSGLLSNEIGIQGSIDGLNFITIYKSDGQPFIIEGTQNDGYYLIPPEISYALPRFIKLAPSDDDEDVIFEVLMREV
jgi:hypothetical protein